MTQPNSAGRPAPRASTTAAGPADGLRVGDSERAEVADLLAWHFSQGRLDRAELDDRLDQAMRAKTRADLTGLVADLPGSEPAWGPGDRLRARRPTRAWPAPDNAPPGSDQPTDSRAAAAAGRHRLGQLALIAAVAVVIALAVRAVTHSVGGWLVLALIAVLWLQSRNRVRR